ncbi:putative membrane protein [Escherichia coli 2-156-04_S3_C2]|nr:putative membrane protein [Escherichia coli 2-156-04_S3_C2]
MCNFKEKENSKHKNVLKVACAILYVFYLFYEHIFFRNFSLIVFFFVILTFIISRLNIKLN